MNHVQPRNRGERVRGAASPEPLMIAVAPNGARKRKADHPAIPLTPEELAIDAAACADAGASMIHLHVRDDDGGHSLDPVRYETASAAIRDAVGDRLIIQITTEAVGLYGRAEQMDSVRAVVPEAVSTAIRELVPDEGAEAEAREFFAWAADAGIRVQYILYDASDVRRFIDLRERGILPGGHCAVLYVLGRYAADRRSVPRDLLPFLQAAHGCDDEWYWSVCAFGPLESACALTAAGLGGHVRVGLENNSLLNDGSLAPDNAALVRQVSDGAAMMSRPVADASTARQMLSRAPDRAPLARLGVQA